MPRSKPAATAGGIGGAGLLVRFLLLAVAAGAALMGGAAVAAAAVSVLAEIPVIAGNPLLGRLALLVPLSLLLGVYLAGFWTSVLLPYFDGKRPRRKRHVVMVSAAVVGVLALPQVYTFTLPVTTALPAAGVMLLTALPFLSAALSYMTGWILLRRIG